MNPNTRRQLRDIQVHAERLINGRPTIEEIEEFDQYNEELKKYLLINLEEPELVERARQLPRILEESDGQVAARGGAEARRELLKSVSNPSRSFVSLRYIATPCI